jgi:hypothetical protein
VFQGTAQPSPDRLRALASSAPREAVLLPFLTRGHWLLLALREYGLPSARVEVLDSAPSHPVARDVARVVRLLGLPPPVHLSLPQQVRNSNDCGVFVILFASAILQRLILPARGYLQGDMFRAALGDPPTFTALVQALANYPSRDASGLPAPRNDPRDPGCPRIAGGDLPSRHDSLRLRSTPTPPSTAHVFPGGVHTVTRRNDPYAPGPSLTRTGALPEARGGAPKQVTRPHAPSTKPHATKSAAFSIDDTPEVEHAVSRLAHALNSYQDSRGYITDAMLFGADLDSLLALAAREAALAAGERTAVLSLMDRSPPPARFVQPLWFGPQADRGHFVLLHAPGDGTAFLHDSAPGFLPGEALALARHRLPNTPIRLVIAAQGVNECGFVVANIARQILEVSHLRNPRPGACRALHAPTLIARHRDALAAAYETLVSITSFLASSGLSPPAEFATLVARVRATGVVQAPPSSTTAATPAPTAPPVIPRSDVASSTADSTTPMTHRWAPPPLPSLEGLFESSVANPLDVGPSNPSQSVAPEKHTTHAPSALAQPPQAFAPPTTSATPPIPTPTSSCLSHGAVRATLRGRPIGTLVRVRWAFRHDAGEWWGTLTRKSDYGVPPEVRFTVARCDQCGSTCAIAPDLTVAVPSPGTVYYEVETVECLPELCDCSCDSDASSVASLRLSGNPEDSDTELNAVIPVTADCDCSCESDTSSLGSSHDDDDVADDVDVPFTQGSSRPVAPPTLGDLFPDERLPTDLPAFAGPLSLKRALEAHIFSSRPSHVPLLAWRSVSDATRRLHIRWLRQLQGIGAPHNHAHAPAAVINHVMSLATKRGWKWSTISSALSTIASAFAALPLYTRHTQTCDLRTDPLFRATMSRAAHLARVSHVSHPTPVLSWERFSSLREKCSTPAVRLLLEISWFFAGRVGDVRKLLPRDLELSPPFKVDGRDVVAVVATFRLGKGAAFAGPYCVRSIVPADVAQRFAGWLATRQPSEPTWTSTHQRALSQICNAERFPLRSIRRGMLVHLGQRGVQHQALMLLSGHKNETTLLRYLGWGRDSSIEAATSRAAQYGGGPTLTLPPKRSPPAPNSALPTTASFPRGPSPTVTAPILGPRMGPFSGVNGYSGQRVRDAPEFFPRHAPSAADLGLTAAVDPTWPLHVKPVGTVRWDAILQLAAELQVPFIDDLRRARDWVTSDRFYGATTPPVIHSPTIAKFRPGDLETLIQAGKVERCATAKNFTSAWLLPQAQKQRFRPIFEPLLNQTLSVADLPILQYPSRLERRATLRRHLVEIDFAAFFDQVALADEVRDHFAFMAAGELWRLTRLPMGARFGPAVAQLLTWLVVADIGKGPIAVCSCIDNIRLSSDNIDALKTAYTTVMSRCSRVGITVNEHTFPTVCDPPVRSLGEELSLVGEQLMVGTCSHHADLLRHGLDHINHTSPKRHVASLVGLALYCSGTSLAPHLHLSQRFELLRAYSQLFSVDEPWDLASPHTAALLPHLSAFVKDVLSQPPVPVPCVPSLPPPPTLSNYDCLLAIDACSTGWAAYALCRDASATLLLQQKFSPPLQHSAHAEPLAVSLALGWLARSDPAPKTIAVLTDHAALVTGQRRPLSGMGGHSTAFYLNKAFATAYRLFARVEFFYVAGTGNVADIPSRNVAGFIFEACHASHPFQRLPRPQHMV